MAQVPGLGLDQSQLADVINQQYKGYSQKQRNQMMQSAAASPDNWGAITQQANKTATQPTEFLGAGRTDNIPSVSLNDQQLGFIPKDTYEQQVSSDPYLQSTNLAPTYSNTSGYYFKPETAKTYSNALSMQDWIKKSNLSIGSSTPVTTLSDFFKSFGSTPTGGWSDANTKFSSDNASLQRWMSDSSFLPQFSLYGSGTPADIQQGFNILQRMSPQNIGEFWGLSPETKKGMLENPANALQFMRATANPANRDWLSIGAEGGYSGIDSYQFDPKKGMTVDPSRYLQIDNSSGGFLGSLNNLAEGIAKWTDPVFYKSMGGGTENSLWKDLTNEGLYSAVFNKLDPILDKIDPGHDWTQDQITGAIGADSQKEAFNQIAPLVLAAVTYGVGSGGAAAGSAAGGTTTGSMASSIMQGVQALNSLNSGDFAGAALSGLGAANVNPSSAFTGKLTGLGMSPDVAKMVGNFGVSAASNLMRGQGMDSALASALFSTASGKAGSELGKALSPTLGEIGSRAIGGAASGGLNSLFNKNNVVAGSLFGGMSGGLHGFLNSTDKQNNTFNKEQNIKNQQQAQNLTKLARMFVKK